MDRGTAKLDKYNRMIDDFNDVTSVSLSTPFNGSIIDMSIVQDADSVSES